MYWVCMSNTYLTYCSYRRCDRDWLPPTWAYTVLASSPTGISKATGFPCLPSFTSSPFLSPDWPVSKRACTVANLLRPHAAVPLFCPPTHTLGKTKKESERKKTLYSTAHTADTTTHTHTHTAHRQKSQSIHSSILFTATRIASPGLSRCTARRLSLTRLVFSRRIPHSRLPPARCSHPSTTITTAAVSSPTEATHWRCTGVGRFLSTRRWADPETNTALPSHRPYQKPKHCKKALATSRARADTRCCDNTPFVHARRNTEPAILLHFT
jgi:hypothetical protein